MPPRGRRPSRAKGAAPAGINEPQHQDPGQGVQDLAAMAGTPEEPRDLGNFNPEGGVGNQGQPRRRREPQHLPTVDDEFTERRARGERIPEVQQRRGEGIDGGEQPIDPDELDTRGAVVPERDRGYEPDPSEIFGAEALQPDGGDELEQGDDRTLHSYDEYEERFLQQDQLIQQLRAQLETVVRGGGAPAAQQTQAAGQPAGALTPDQVNEILRYDRLLPFSFTEATAEALGMTGQGVQVLDTALRQVVRHAIMVGAQLFAPELQRIEARIGEFEPVRRTVDAQTVQQAFYGAHRDLVGYEEEAASIWDRYARAYPNASPEQMIRAVGAATRKYVRERGIRPRQAVQRQAPAAAPRTSGMLGQQPISTRRVRPAVADGGGASGGRVNGTGRPLSPVQRDLAQMAGLNFMH